MSKATSRQSATADYVLLLRRRPMLRVQVVEEKGMQCYKDNYPVSTLMMNEGRCDLCVFVCVCVCTRVRARERVCVLG